MTDPTQHGPGKGGGRSALEYFVAFAVNFLPVALLLGYPPAGERLGITGIIALFAATWLVGNMISKQFRRRRPGKGPPPS